MVVSVGSLKKNLLMGAVSPCSGHCAMKDRCISQWRLGLCRAAHRSVLLDSALLGLCWQSRQTGALLLKGRCMYPRYV